MTQSITDSRPTVDAPRVTDATALRVDGAHEHGDGKHPEAPSPAQALAALPEAPPDLDFDQAAQLQRQAQQLAAHLVVRQRDLDHREATLHAEAAAREAELVQARFLADERERELNAREQTLQEREAELAACESALAKRESAVRREQVEAELFLRREEEQLELRESQVALVEERLANEQRLVRQLEKELKDARERFRRASHRLEQRQARRRVEFEQQAKLHLESLERRRAAMESQAPRQDDAESSPQVEIEQLRTVLRMELLAVRRMLDDQEQSAADWAREQATFQTEQQAEVARLAEHEAELAALSESIDARRAAVERSEAELAAEHQRVLRERLALEELWVRFAGNDQLDAHRPRLMEIEARLAERFADAEARLSDRADELNALREAIAEEYARAQRQQSALETWKAAKEREFADKHRALTRKAEELDERAAKLRREEVEFRLKRLQR